MSLANSLTSASEWERWGIWGGDPQPPSRHRTKASAIHNGMTIDVIGVTRKRSGWIFAAGRCAVPHPPANRDEAGAFSSMRRKDRGMKDAWILECVRKAKNQGFPKALLLYLQKYIDNFLAMPGSCRKCLLCIGAPTAMIDAAPPPVETGGRSLQGRFSRSGSARSSGARRLPDSGAWSCSPGLCCRAGR